MISSKSASSEALAKAKGSGRCEDSTVDVAMGSTGTTSGVSRSPSGTASAGCGAAPVIPVNGQRESKRH